MTDPSNIRRPSLLLTLAGVASSIFFLATDPRSGISARLTGTGPLDPAHRLHVLIRTLFGEPTVDAVHQATIPTLIGLAGSLVIILIGLRLLTRKSA
jgi:hypothetical protein